MISPTGLGVRNDRAGYGYFDAPRSKTVKGKVKNYRHAGTDFLCTPGHEVVMPFDSGKGLRMAYPYADRSLDGVLFKCVERGKVLYCKMFYFNPVQDVLQRNFQQGEVIGHAQDVTSRYQSTEMQPHVHLEITGVDPTIFMQGEEQ